MLKASTSSSSLVKSHMTGHLPPKHSKAGASGQLAQVNRGPAFRSLLMHKEGFPPSMFHTLAKPSSPAVTSMFFVGASCKEVHATSWAINVHNLAPSALATIFLTSKQATPPLSTLAK